MPESAIDLAGAWRLSRLDGAMACDCPLPGDAHSALIAAGLIPDPYAGMNEYAVRAIADADWRMTRDFDFTGEGDWYLDVDGLDTVAEIRLNGVLVLDAENAFRRYRPDVTEALLQGGNRIEIVFRSNVREAAERAAKQPWPIPYAAQNCPIPHGNMLRKPACHYGWDWNLAIAPFGLYGRIALRRLGIARIEHVQAFQHHGVGGSVEIEVVTTLYSSRGGATEIVTRFAGATRTATIALAPGETRQVERFTVERPELWHPAGLGPQTLHELTVACEGATERRRIGLRRVELLTNADEAGARFAFRINGREHFARGANWIPADALPSRATPDLTRRLLQAAVDANMTMIRVWGGGFYEQDWFYDLCDELGLLVWQDFMFACNLYPADNAFLEEVRAEADFQVRRIGHHACLALWCGDNELIGALNWFAESRENRDRYLVSYDRLNRTIEAALKAADPTAIWWPSSPSPGPLSFGDAWHDDSSGDMHFWSVWHEGCDFDHYRDVRPRFCSEFGFQSFPSLPAIGAFADAIDCNIAAPVMESHQKNAGGNARIAETMFRSFRFPEGFDNFVYLSQIQQGVAIATAVAWFRSLKPHCMGALYWQLNDTWPCASWSSLDHGGAWKALHHMARRFFAPAAAFIIPDRIRGVARIVAVNDNDRPVTVTARLRRVSAAGAVQDLAAFSGEVGTEEAVTLGEIPVAAFDGAFLFLDHAASDGSAGRSHHASQPWKRHALVDPNIAMTVEQEGGGALLTLTARRPAFFVSLEADRPGRFSDNVFDLLPGETVRVRFAPDEAAAHPPGAARFVRRDLFSSYQRSA